MAKNVLFAPLLGTREVEEWQRLDRVIEEADASRVRLLTMPTADEAFPSVREYARKQLHDLAKRDRRLSWDETHVNLFSFEECLAAFARLFAEERGNDITVSLGTGGGAGAVASTVSCLLWGGRGVYVGSPGYGEIPVEGLPRWLHMTGPVGADELRVLQLLVDEPEGLDKKTIIERLKTIGRIRPEQDKHAYRRLSSHFLPRLEEHGFVEVGPLDDWDRRRHSVRITDEGRRAFRVLSPMLNEPKGTLHLRGGRASTKATRL